MSTVFEIGGRPIISFNGDWDNNINTNTTNFSATPTVVLDPAAFLKNWKKQIQRKHNIPAHQQRLIFPGSNFFSWNCASQDQSANEPAVGNFVTCLQSWQAILRSEKRNIARLLYPEVLTESDNLPSELKSKTAEEIRNLGIPCSVYYLSFDKCILAPQSQTCQGEAQDCKEVSNLCIKVNKDFQLKEFEVDLYGRLSKSSHPLHFQYLLNGRHLVAHLSMFEQTVHYRQGQKMRHDFEKGKDSVDKLVDGNTTGTLINTDKSSTLVKPTTSRDYYLPGSKDLVAVISPTRELREVRVALIFVDLQRQLQTFLKPGSPLTPPFSRSDKIGKRAIEQAHGERAIEQAQLCSSKGLPKSTKINNLSETKTPECTKKKSMISGKSKDSKSEEESSNFQTDRLNTCSSTEKSVDTSKFDETIKKPSKKKKKKGKNKQKHSGGHTQVPFSKESSEDASLGSGCNVTSTFGSGYITVRNGDVASIHKNKIKSARNPELFTILKGATADGQFSCKNSAPISQETSAEEFSASTQNAISNKFLASPQNGTSNILTDPIGRKSDNSRITNNHTVISTEASLDHCREANGIIDFQTDSNVIYGNGCIYNPINSKFVSVNKSRRSSDSHGTGNWTHVTSTNLDFPKSTFKAGGTPNGHLHGGYSHAGSGGVNNIETVNNDITSMGSHDKNKHFPKVGKSRESQSGDKKFQVARGKRVAGNNFGLLSCSSGSTGSCGIGSVQSRSGKESNQSVWQKVQKNTLNGHIQESGDSENRQLPATLDPHTVLPTVNLNSEKNSAVQVSPKYSGEYGNVLSKYSKQKSHDFWNRRDSHDPPTRVRVKESSNRSQHMRDDNSGWSLDGETLHIMHRDATNTGIDFEEMKKWCCCSEISIQSCQEGTLDLSCQTNPLRRFPAEDSNISHQYAEMHHTDQKDKWKSSSAPSTPCQHGDALQPNRDHFTLANIGENDIDQCFNLQHVTQQKVPVGAISAAVVMACTPNTGALDTQHIDIRHNDHEGSNETHKVHAASNNGSKSTISVQETDAINHAGQMNLTNNEHVIEVSCKCSSCISLPASSSNAEFEKMAQAISGSILTSYESQLASESISHALGAPLAEFEKVLYAVSPEIKPSLCADKCSSHSRNLGITNLVCRCQIADIPLINIWHWFEEAGNYGLEVKAEEFGLTGRSNIDGFFRAYFVPYLSGIQLFGFSGLSQSFCKGAVNSAKQETSEKINKVEDSYLSHFANLPILSTLLPKPSAETATAPVCSADTSNISSNAGNHSCSTLFEYSGYGETEILFEFFESQLPQQRRPMFQKIRELINSDTDSSCQVFGDPHILESIKLQDLHPASWFSVAWYPIYRIPEGQLRSAFLTYHSLGHFVHRDTSSRLVGDSGSCIVAPVVGLQSYSAQVVETRFASHTIVLRRLVRVKEALCQMVISNKWGGWKQADTKKAKIVKDLIFSDDFWNRVEYALELTEPLMSMLRYADMDEPCLGNIYDAMDSMLERMKSAEGWFVPKKQFEHAMKENISANPSDALKERLKTLEETGSMLARGCAKKDRTSIISKHSDYEFFLSRRR